MSFLKALDVLGGRSIRLDPRKLAGLAIDIDDTFSGCPYDLLRQNIFSLVLVPHVEGDFLPVGQRKTHHGFCDCSCFKPFPVNKDGNMRNIMRIDAN